MITLLIALGVALLVAVAVGATGIGGSWAVLAGVLAFMLVAALMTRHFGKRLKLVVGQVQTLMEGARDDVQKTANRIAARPGTGAKAAQRQLEKRLEEGVRASLEALEQAKPIYPWVVLSERQVNTLRFQLLYQIKQFDEADQLLDKILVFDPVTLCMKMVRQQANGDERYHKIYKKGLRRFRGDKACLVYATYAWLLLQDDRQDQAMEVLDEAKEKTENPVLTSNWQHLANGKPKQVSFAKLGEEWYSLNLEAPPKARASKGQLKGHPLYGKGKRRFM